MHQVTKKSFRSVLNLRIRQAGLSGTRGAPFSSIGRSDEGAQTSGVVINGAQTSSEESVPPISEVKNPQVYGGLSAQSNDTLGARPSEQIGGSVSSFSGGRRTKHRRSARLREELESCEGFKGGIGFASGDLTLECEEATRNGEENRVNDEKHDVYNVFKSGKGLVDHHVFSNERSAASSISDAEFTGYIDDYGNPITKSELLRTSSSENDNVPEDADSEEAFFDAGARSSSPPEACFDSERAILESVTETDQESFPRFQSDFVDKMWFEVRAGNGGEPVHGSTRAWDRHKGPAYGGHGQDVFLKSSHLVENLIDLPKKIRAADGGDGHGTERGKNQKEQYIPVPIGTIVRERKPFRTPDGQRFRTAEGRRVFLPEFTFQFLEDGETLLVAKGGKGGVAPFSFKKNDGRKGELGVRKLLELEYRIPNDVALIGINLVYILGFTRLSLNQARNRAQRTKFKKVIRAQAKAPYLRRLLVRTRGLVPKNFLRRGPTQA